MALLEIENLSVSFPTKAGVLQAVENVSLSLEAGDVLGIVGESGSGKSVTMMALMGLVPFPGRVSADRLRFDGHDLASLSPRERSRLTGKDLAMIFQDPTTSLNPCFTIGFQLAETLKLHLGMDGKAAHRRSIELLEQVGIPAPESRLTAFPHQMSGGMNQRVMIAMAIACNPKLLIADEPTTALDVTIQAQILDLLRSLQKERGMALVLITHNMGVVAEMAQRIAVMYAGQIVEERPANALFAAPRHPYTEALIAAMPERSDGHTRLATIPGMVPGLHERPSGCLFAPRCTYTQAPCWDARPPLSAIDGGKVRCLYPLGVVATPKLEAEVAARAVPDDVPEDLETPVVTARDLRQTYRIGRGFLRQPAELQAVSGVSFDLMPGKTLAVVGESGCGKSTLARMVSLIEPPVAGELSLAGVDVATASAADTAGLRRVVQLVFQNPYGSLNPRKKIGAILEAPLEINSDLAAPQRAEKARDMLARVGLRPEHYDRYPHMFSGGQRQRIAIARALMLNPALVVADEPVSALDVCIQAQVLNLLSDLQSELGLAFLFISHDLGVVRHIAHDVLVMYLGHAVEQGDKEAIFTHPLHPYTQALLASTPGVHTEAGTGRTPLKGELPSPLNPPSGCVFSTRCPHAIDRCRAERPMLRMLAGRQVACHLAEQFTSDGMMEEAK
jgi:peptide/nickel transport system ATP-binding protein